MPAARVSLVMGRFDGDDVIIGWSVFNTPMNLNQLAIDAEAIIRARWTQSQPGETVSLRSVIPTTLTPREIRAYQVDVKPSPPPGVVPTQNLVAGGGGASLPDPTSCCINLYTNQGGRQGRGRVFIPWGAALSGSGRFTLGQVRGITKWWAAMLADFRVQGWNPIVWSPTYQMANSVQYVRADDVPDHVRRRKLDAIFVHEEPVAFPPPPEP